MCERKRERDGGDDERGEKFEVLHHKKSKFLICIKFMFCSVFNICNVACCRFQCTPEINTIPFFMMLFLQKTKGHSSKPV